MRKKAPKALVVRWISENSETTCWLNDRSCSMLLKISAKKRSGSGGCMDSRLLTISSFHHLKGLMKTAVSVVICCTNVISLSKISLAIWSRRLLADRGDKGQVEWGLLLPTPSGADRLVNAPLLLLLSGLSKLSMAVGLVMRP